MRNRFALVLSVLALFCCLVSCKPEPKFYNVTFNSNGAEGVGPDAVAVAEGSSMNLPSECGLTKDGYYFAGWSKAPDLVGTVLKAGERIEVMSDIVFYAMWSRSSYNVTFNANGAEGDVPDSAMVNAGGYFTVPSQGKLSMEGYVFDGWNTQANGEGVSYAENKFVEGVYADIELYAQWKKLHTITLDANKDDGSSPSTVKVVDGGLYTIPNCGFLPAKDKVFSGWSTEENGAGKIFYEGNEIDPVTADLTLYAVWIEDPLEYEFDASSYSWIVKGFKDGVGDEYKRDVVISALRYDGNPVMSIGDSAFRLCTNIKSVSIPDGLENIGDFAFYSCSNLESIVIPNGVRSIGKTAFYGCNLLEEIVIPASVTSIGNSAFAYCTKLESIKVDSGNRVYYAEGNCLMEKASKKLVRGCGDSIVPADTNIIGSNAFSGLVSLTQIGIPEGVERICNEAFSGCVELEKATIPSSVTSLEMYAFAACKKLVEITIPSKVASIGLAAFSDCSNLKEVLISEGVGSIGDHAFSGCTNLEKITIPSSVTSIDSFALYVIDPEATLNIFYGGSREDWNNRFNGKLFFSSSVDVHCSNDPQV